MNSNNVLAVDVGFGNTKAVWGNGGSPASEIIFRSIVKRTLEDPRELGAIGTGLNRIGINLGGQFYLVGPDAYLAGGVPTIDSNFVNRKEYLALLRGAMYYMIQATGKVKDIDCLVVGLPVGNFTNRRADLVRACKGLHSLPTPPALIGQYGQNIEIKVSSVLVLPQPIGALRLAGTPQGGLITIKPDDVNVIIDPGYHTFDWVMTKGQQMDFDRSSSFGGGVSHLLQQVASQAGKQLGLGMLDAVECEKALKTGVLEVNGKQYAFTRYREYAESLAEETVDQFMNATNLDRAITRIILTGGGAGYYKKALQSRFDSHTIVCAEDSVMGNARGFYLWAKDSQV